MRSLVFAAFLTAGFAVTVQAQNSLSTSCIAPGACFVVNTSPCGSIMAVDNYGSAGVLGPNDTQLDIGYHSVRGACGFFAPPYYSGEPRNSIPETHCTGNDCVVNLHDLQ